MEKAEKEKPHRTPKENRRSSLSDEPSEPQISVNLDGETKKGEPLYEELNGFLIPAYDSVQLV